jgi:hypothetical protein
VVERTSHFSQCEAFKIAAYGYLRSQHLEPPATQRLRLAVGQREERLVRETAAQLSPATRHAVDALIKTQTPENPADTEQMPLFPIRSELAMVKDDADLDNLGLVPNNPQADKEASPAKRGLHPLFYALLDPTEDGRFGTIAPPRREAQHETSTLR